MEENMKVNPIEGKEYGIGLLSHGEPDINWPNHPRNCKCRGMGYIHVPASWAGECNCGSGEGCSLHNEAWMPVVVCDGGGGWMNFTISRIQGVTAEKQPGVG